MTQLSPTQRQTAVAYLLDCLDGEILARVEQAINAKSWPGDWHFGLGLHVRNQLRQKFDWDELLLDAEWTGLVEQAAREYSTAVRSDGVKVIQTLSPLPPRLHSAAQTAAENLAFIAADEGIYLGGVHDEGTPPLVALLQTIRERCIEAEVEPRPYLGDLHITPQEIAAVLETIALLLQSDANYEFAGRNPSWFSDAARVVEWLVQQATD